MAIMFSRMRASIHLETDQESDSEEPVLVDEEAGEGGLEAGLGDSPEQCSSDPGGTFLVVLMYL